MNHSNAPDFDLSSCGQKISPRNIAFVAFFSFVLLVGLGGNILVCIGVIACRSLRSAANVLLASLALSDIGVCLTIIPFRIMEYLNSCPRRHTCILFMAADVACSTSSVLTLLVISIDRYLAVCLPYSYPRLVTSRRTLAVCVAIWLYSSVWAVAAPFSWHSQTVSIDVQLGKCVNFNVPYTMTVNAIHFYLPLIAISVIYSKLWMIAKNEEALIEAVSLRTSSRVVNKSTRTVAIVYLAFLVSWLPNAILVTIFTIKPQIFHALQIENEKAALVVNDIFVEILPPLNSALNPFIYGFYNGQFRAAFFGLLTRKGLRGVSGRTQRFSTATRNMNTNMVCLEESCAEEANPRIEAEVAL